VHEVKFGSQARAPRRSLIDRIMRRRGHTEQGAAAAGQPHVADAESRAPTSTPSHLNGAEHAAQT
jgi:hypothetical protein